MRIVEMLNDSLVRLQSLCIWYVVEPEQQVIWRRLYILIDLGDLRRVLSSVTSAILYSSVHADTECIGARPLAPSVAILRGRVGTKVCVEDVCQCLDSEVAAVIFVCGPRPHGHVCESVKNVLIETKRQSDPVLKDRL